MDNSQFFSYSSYFGYFPPSLLTNQSAVSPDFASVPPPLCLSPTPYLLCPGFCPQLSSALMFDAVHVVVGAVRELNRSQEIGVKPLSCTSPQIWQHGTSLMNYLRMVNAWETACLYISLHGKCVYLKIIHKIKDFIYFPHAIFLPFAASPVCIGFICCQHNQDVFP